MTDYGALEIARALRDIAIQLADIAIQLARLAKTAEETNKQ